ncbi:hypothetical protein T210_0127335 [Burkholderia pseudomallei MSHR6137]|nr:hypothetical protein T210_0127335 [Burkholderia pseudomallei MSHR6137]
MLPEIVHRRAVVVSFARTARGRPCRGCATRPGAAVRTCLGRLRDKGLSAGAGRGGVRDSWR